LDKVKPGYINRNYMDELIRVYILKYKDLGYETFNLKKASRRALLLWKSVGLIETKESIVRGRGKSSYISNIEVSFSKLLLKDRSLSDFLIFSYKPYKLIKLGGGEEFLFSDSFFSLKRVRVSSIKNKNTCRHGILGALKLSQTPIKVDKDSISILKEELEGEFVIGIEGDLLKKLDGVGISVDDLKNTSMSWWWVILENNSAARDLNRELFTESRELFDLPALKKKLLGLIRLRNSIIKGFNSSLGIPLTPAKASSHFFKKKAGLSKKVVALIKDSGRFDEFLSLEPLLEDIESRTQFLKDAELQWSKSHS